MQRVPSEMMSINRGPSTWRACAGATLMEILVSLIVVSLGLLGVATLQAKSLKTTQEAYYYSQAAFYAYDIAERIRVNSAAVDDYATSVTSTYVIDKDCEGSQCSKSEMADYDLNRWITTIASHLPDAAAAIAVTGGDPTLVDIKIRWKGAAGAVCEVDVGEGYSCFNLKLEVSDS